MTTRSLMLRLLTGSGEIDATMGVRICRRDENGCITETATLPIRLVDTHNNICVEESEIVWKPFN